MKKIVLSAVAVLTLGSVLASASAVKLYSDKNGQVFTQAGEGRTLIKEVEQKSTSLFAGKSSKIKFGGKSYLGYTYTDFDKASKKSESEFELRRLYFDVKAYLLQDPKSYFRVTFDRTTKDNYRSSTDSRTDKYEEIYVKYAYMYLNNVLPYTGVEIGQAHRPWVDYEQNNSWNYRSIQKVFSEDGNGAHINSSADLGVNFKTKTKYFSSEIGLFQGEGYHDEQVSNGVSFEWRTTAHLLGVNGKGNATKKTYWEASFYGQYNMDHYEYTNSAGNDAYDDLIFYGLHTVFNTPSFQIAAQYVYSDNTSDELGHVSKGAGDGYNAHILGRFGEKKQFATFARYDTWTPDAVSGATEQEQKTYTVGASWQQNKNIQWVANMVTVDNDDKDDNYDAYMLTAEVKF